VNNPDVMNKLKDKFPQTELFRVEDHLAPGLM
jgi:sulfate transport system substrate-binding protein